MEGKDFERKNGGAVNEDESAIGDWEGEGGFVPPREETGLNGEKREQAEPNKEKGNFIDRAAKYCRMVGGKLLCGIGEHKYIEVGRETYHDGTDMKINLECSRTACPSPRAWTKWRKGKRVL